MEKGGGAEVVDDDSVDFLVTGDTVVGEFRCSECGYGISISRAKLPLCPMCGGSSWEPI